jgi:hypothetical protein
MTRSLDLMPWDATDPFEMLDQPLLETIGAWS